LAYDNAGGNFEQSSQGEDSAEEMEKGLRLGGVLIIFMAPGLIVLGWFTEALRPMLGVSALMVFIGIGLLVAARIVGPSKHRDSGPA
jgi:hypothetical protein